MYKKQKLEVTNVTLVTNTVVRGYKCPPISTSWQYDQ